MKFFINSGTQSYLRELADEFGESTNAVRIELNRLAKAGLLDSQSHGRMKYYRANSRHPLFPEIHNIVKKNLGIDFVETVVKRLGDVEAAFITGDYACGYDSGVIDLVVVGDINRNVLNELIEAAEKKISRKIRSFILAANELEKFKDALDSDKALIIWKKNVDNKKVKG